MRKEEILSNLKDYFRLKADAYAAETAFLYGSRAFGYPKEESDVDVAVSFGLEMGEDKIFDIINNISLELADLLKLEVNILHIDRELSKPMLFYNAVVHGIPVYIRDFTKYVDMKLNAIARMEDFSIFGTGWQSEIVKRRLEALDHARV